MTHDELVVAAKKWLLKRSGGRAACSIVITDMTSSVSETPDAIGWYGRGNSVLVECKASLADFRADKHKYFRRVPSEGVGRQRYYFAPQGMIDRDALPESWGLVDVDDAGRTFTIRRSGEFEASERAEVAMLMSLLRRLKVDPGKHVAIRSYTIHSAREPRATVTFNQEKPMNQYKVIYADPPWPYDDKAAAGKRGVGFKYDVMTERGIKGLPVETIAAPDCVLFLWATPPRLPLALMAMRTWGFEFKTIAFTWVKRTKNDKLHWGMGNWTRANPENVLLGIRGNPKRVEKGVHSVVEAKVREHSRKPDEVRDRIVRLMGDVPRVELFARERVEGWSAWGNEVECDFEFPGAVDLADAFG